MEAVREAAREGDRTSKFRRVGSIILAVIVAFMLGFAPQWLRTRAVQEELETVRFENQMLELEGRVGAALAESQRGNAERARQLMASFFSLLEARMDQVEDPGHRQELEAIMLQRDEIITLLSRASPEAPARLNLLYTRYFAVAHPLGREGVPAVTPNP